MDEYIKREAAIREIEQINPVDYGAMWDYEAHHYAGECLRDCKEATRKKMPLKSGTGGLTMAEYIESNRKHEFNPNGKDKGGEM